MPSTPTPRSAGHDFLRRFRDALGVEWSVWEVGPADVAMLPERLKFLEGALAQGWLAFESEHGERRRLTAFPHGWEESTDGQLRGMLSRAAPVDPTTSLG